MEHRYEVRCLCCGKILISRGVHDMVGCGCENGTFVDGGNDYLRAGGKDPSKIEMWKRNSRTGEMARVKKDVG